VENTLKTRSRSAKSNSIASASAAFTLVELLVVIAIIALLVGILLPALRKARMEGWRVVSLANVRSIAQAGAGYQTEQKGYLPITPTGTPVPPVIGTWCPWTGWGNDCSAKWADTGNGAQDIAAAARPLNQYLSSQPIPDIRTPEHADSRGQFKLAACRDPSDKIGHQWDWNSPERSTWTPEALPNFDGSTCYEDIGSSYMWQSKWFFQTVRTVGGSWDRAFRFGCERLRLADSFQPSRMIWVNDEYCDITINRTRSDAQVKNGYGDINKSVVGYLDGHARYLSIIPGGETDPLSTTQPWLVPAFNNADYTVVFTDLRRN
jgi:prepilin-type N-terminal cleavage/methylation domain-containing protein